MYGFYPKGGGGTPYDGLYGEAPPERGTVLPFSDLRYMEGYGTLSFGSVKVPKSANRLILFLFIFFLFYFFLGRQNVFFV